jgi:hypothetical protein
MSLVLCNCGLLTRMRTLWDKDPCDNLGYALVVEDRSDDGTKADNRHARSHRVVIEYDSAEMLEGATFHAACLHDEGVLYALFVLNKETRQWEKIKSNV